MPCPSVRLGVFIGVTANPPAARLRLSRRREGPGAALALVAHGLLVLALVWRGAALLERGPGSAGSRGGGGGRPAVRFFTLPAAGPPAAIEIPAPQPVTLSDVPMPEPITLDLARIDIPREPIAGTVSADERASGAGDGGGAGQGPGAGAGTGAQAGPGTGGEGGYIFPASPRWLVLVPLNAPASVKGRRYEVRFWVSAEGRVTRVEVDPPIAHAGYRREFMERMMAYLFNPATTRDGQRIASVYSITLTP